jgi:DNA-binding transcriptional LysR family regulator
MVQSGLGIGFLPEACILPYGDAMGLAAIRLTDGWAFRSLSICTRHAQSLPVAAQLLLRHLSEGAQQTPANPA